MKALLQRVTHASVAVGGDIVGEIGPGVLVFLGVEQADDSSTVRAMTERILAYRLFADEQGKMNRSVRDIAGGVLLVSQFTLAANTKKGLRPSFSSAAAPALAELLYEEMLALLREAPVGFACGRFGADMQVGLVNDGPVTFLLEI